MQFLCQGRYVANVVDGKGDSIRQATMDSSREQPSGPLQRLLWTTGRQLIS
jgi:hypothetical protein